MKAKTQVKQIEEIRELYRRLGMKRWGTLYFKRYNRSWRTWDSDDVAMIKNGAVRHKFKSLEALRQAIYDEMPDPYDPINWD